MKTKDQSVKMRITEPLFLEFLFVVDDAYRVYDSELTITSGSETSAVHSRTSLHYAGRAVDTRSWTIQRYDLDAKGQHRVICGVRDEYLSAMGLPLDTIDVVLESSHIHIEWQPKRQ